MKKILLTVFAIFATTAMIKATDEVVYPENPYGWIDKEAMFQAFMTDAGKSTGGKTIDDFKAMAGTADSDDGLHNLGLCKYLDNASAAYAMTEKWGWLKEYINAVRAEQGFAEIAGGADAASKYETGAFFICGQSTGWPKGADFSKAGKDENYIPAWGYSYVGTSGTGKVANDAVKVAVNGGVISVTGAENVAIYNAAGALVSTSTQANVPAGLYIVKAGKNVQKVMVK